MRLAVFVFLLSPLFILGGCKGNESLSAVLVIPTESHTTVVHESGVLEAGHHDADNGYGPPPHAPAHGYRHHHHDVDLVFDSGLGVYVVAEMSDIYFYNDLYIRFSNDSWQVGIKTDGPWRVAKNDEIPEKLYKTKGPKNYKGKGKAKGLAKQKGW